MDWDEVKETVWGFWLLALGVWTDIVMDCRGVKKVITSVGTKKFTDYETRVKVDGSKDWQDAKIENWAMKALKPFVLESGQQKDDVISFQVKREEGEDGYSQLTFRES